MKRTPSLPPSLPPFNPNPNRNAMENQQEKQQNHSLKPKQRLSICFSCIFRSIRPRGPVQHNQRPRLFRSSSSLCQRSTKQDHPVLKERCRSFISRIGKSHQKNSDDLRYDPLSYSLNFDDGPDESGHADFRFRSFSARLPASPPSPRPPPQREMMVWD